MHDSDEEAKVFDEEDSDEDADEQAGDSDEEDLRPRPKKRKQATAARRSQTAPSARRPVKNPMGSGPASTLFRAVGRADTALSEVVNQWVSTAESDPNRALAGLLNFFLHCCGVQEQLVDERSLLVQDNAPLDELLPQDWLVDVAELPVSSFPVLHRTKKHEIFRANFAEFWRRLVQTSSDTSLLASLPGEADAGHASGLLARVVDWCITLASVRVRPVRHTAAFAAMHVGLAVIHALQDTERQQAAAKEQASALTASTSQSARSRRIRSEADRLESKRATLRQHLDALFDGVFVHRYRDVDATIRATVMEYFGQWLAAYPVELLTNDNLKYCGWMLSDTHPLVRRAALSALHELLSDEQNGPQLAAFMERFRERISVMTRDRDPLVAETALETLRAALLLLCLVQADVEEVETAICSRGEHPVRAAAARFLLDQVPAFGYSLVEARQATAADRSGRAEAGGQPQVQVGQCDHLAQCQLKALLDVVERQRLVLAEESVTAVTESTGAAVASGDAVERAAEAVERDASLVHLLVDGLWGQDGAEVLCAWEAMVMLLQKDDATADAEAEVVAAMEWPHHQLAETTEEDSGRDEGSSASARRKVRKESVKVQLTLEQWPLLLHLLAATVKRAHGTPTVQNVRSDGADGNPPTTVWPNMEIPWKIGFREGTGLAQAASREILTALPSLWDRVRSDASSIRPFWDVVSALSFTDTDSAERSAMASLVDAAVWTLEHQTDPRMLHLAAQRLALWAGEADGAASAADEEKNDEAEEEEEEEEKEDDDEEEDDEETAVVPTRSQRRKSTPQRKGKRAKSQQESPGQGTSRGLRRKVRSAMAALLGRLSDKISELEPEPEEEGDEPTPIDPAQRLGLLLALRRLACIAQHWDMGSVASEWDVRASASFRLAHEERDILDDFPDAGEALEGWRKTARSAQRHHGEGRGGAVHCLLRILERPFARSDWSHLCKTASGGAMREGLRLAVLLLAWGMARVRGGGSTRMEDAHGAVRYFAGDRGIWVAATVWMRRRVVACASTMFSLLPPGEPGLVEIATGNDEGNDGDTEGEEGDIPPTRRVTGMVSSKDKASAVHLLGSIHAGACEALCDIAVLCPPSLGRTVLRPLAWIDPAEALQRRMIRAADAWEPPAGAAVQPVVQGKWAVGDVGLAGEAKYDGEHGDNASRLAMDAALMVGEDPLWSAEWTLLHDLQQTLRRAKKQKKRQSTSSASSSSLSSEAVKAATESFPAAQEKVMSLQEETFAESILASLATFATVASPTGSVAGYVLARLHGTTSASAIARLTMRLIRSRAPQETLLRAHWAAFAGQTRIVAATAREIWVAESRLGEHQGAAAEDALAAADARHDDALKRLVEMGRKLAMTLGVGKPKGDTRVAILRLVQRTIHTGLTMETAPNGDKYCWNVALLDAILPYVRLLRVKDLTELLRSFFESSLEHSALGLSADDVDQIRSGRADRAGDWRPAATLYAILCSGKAAAAGTSKAQSAAGRSSRKGAAKQRPAADSPVRASHGGRRKKSSAASPDTPESQARSEQSRRSSRYDAEDDHVEKEEENGDEDEDEPSLRRRPGAFLGQASLDMPDGSSSRSSSVSSRSSSQKKKKKKQPQQQQQQRRRSAVRSRETALSDDEEVPSPKRQRRR